MIKQAEMKDLPMITELACRLWPDHTAEEMRTELADMIAISESTPGPIAVNMATFVGFRTCGFFGAFFATLGVVLPSFIVILLIASVLKNFTENKYFKAVMSGIKPVVVALIAVPVFNLAKSARLGWSMAWVPVLSALLIVFLGVSPIYVIIVAGVAGYLYGKMKGGEA